MQRELHAIHSAELSPGQAPEWVQLFQSGTNSGRDGRGPYILADASAVIQASRAYHGGADIPIDYDHQSVWCRENGRPAPAAGWIKELAARSDGLWGRVEWTPQAAEYLSNKQYRYLSPYFNYTPSGNVARVLSAALTNNPNLELAALASQLPGANVNKFLETLAKAMGLPQGATEDAVAAHAQTLATAQAKLPELAKALGAPEGAGVDVLVAHASQAQTRFDQALASVAKAMGMSEGVTPEQLAAHASTLRKPEAPATAVTPDPAKYVPVDQVAAMSAQLKGLMAERATAMVDQAIKDFKVPPALKVWAEDYASRDEAGFKAYLDQTPVVVPPGATGPLGAPQNAEAMSAEDAAICSALGVKQEDYIKMRQEGAKGEAGK